MSTYRDDAETIREALNKANAEIARLKTESSTREVVVWRDSANNHLPWVSRTLFVMLMALIFLAGSAVKAEQENYHRLALVFLGGISLLIAVGIWVWIKSLPRAPAKKVS